MYGETSEDNVVLTEFFDVGVYARQGGRDAAGNNPCAWSCAEAWTCFLEAHDDELNDALSNRMCRSAFRQGWSDRA